MPNRQFCAPQHRERIIIVGFREKSDFTWDDLVLPDISPNLSTILHPKDGSEKAEGPYITGQKAMVNPKYVLSPKLGQYLQNYVENHHAAGNGFGFGHIDSDSVTYTFFARYHKDGFKILGSDIQAYKQFSQAADSPMIKAVARIIVHCVKKQIEKKAA